MGNYDETDKKIGLNGRNQGGEAEILLPSASAGVRGHPRHLWAEHGRWKLENYEEKQRKIGQMAETRAGWRKYCFRQLPRMSVDIRGMCGRKTEDAIRGIMRKTREKSA